MYGCIFIPAGDSALAVNPASAHPVDAITLKNLLPVKGNSGTLVLNSDFIRAHITKTCRPAAVKPVETSEIIPLALVEHDDSQEPRPAALKYEEGKLDPFRADADISDPRGLVDL